MRYTHFSKFIFGMICLLSLTSCDKSEVTKGGGGVAPVAPKNEAQQKSISSAEESNLFNRLAKASPEELSAILTDLGEQGPDIAVRTLISGLKSGGELSIGLISLFKDLECAHHLHRDLLVQFGKSASLKSSIFIVEALNLFSSGNNRELFASALFGAKSGESGIMFMEANGAALFEGETQKYARISANQIVFNEMAEVDTILQNISQSPIRIAITERAGMTLAKSLALNNLVRLNLGNLDKAEQAVFISNFIGIKAQTQRDEFLAYISDGNVKPLSDEFINSGVRVMIENSMSTGSKWAVNSFDKIPVKYQPQAAIALTDQWLYADAVQASTWVNSLPKGTTKDWAVKRVVNYLIGVNDLDSATKWLPAISNEVDRKELELQIKTGPR
jgi:hypothetical protein